MSRPKAFVVEDDATTARLLGAVLEKEGLSTVLVDRATGAVQSARATAPDVILLDISLPDGDGYSLCAELRAEPALAGVPVLFLSSLVTLESRLRCFAVGGQDFIPKPFAPPELAARVRAQLAAKAPRDEGIRQSVTDMVVHDLKSPLGTIKIALTILQERLTVEDPALARMFKGASVSADLALPMVNDLLDLGEGRLKVSRAPLELKDLLDRLRETLEPQALRVQTSVSFPQPPEGPAYSTDSMLVYRILVNLLVNAVKFSAWGKGEVRLEAGRTPGGGVRFAVCDQGPGIPDAEKASVFLKYFRGESARSTAAPGSGIGLSFCKLAVDALGGSIRVEDNQPRGSRFIVELPPG